MTRKRSYLIMACVSVFLMNVSSATSQGTASGYLPGAAPRPHSVQVETPGPEVFNDPKYLELAKYVGWAGATAAVDAVNHTSADIRAKRDFHQWLLEHHIEVFDEKRVSAYLQGLADAANKEAKDRCGRDCSGGIIWGYQYQVDWFPLQGRSPASWGSVTCGTNGNCQQTSTPPPLAQYTKPIPKRILALMSDIKDCYPDVQFEVSDIVQIRDPFLRVRFAWGTEIIAKWDEPSFQ